VRPVEREQLEALGVQLPRAARRETRRVYRAPLDDAMMARIKARVARQRATESVPRDDSRATPGEVGPVGGGAANPEETGRACGPSSRRRRS